MVSAKNLLRSLVISMVAGGMMACGSKKSEDEKAPTENSELTQLRQQNTKLQKNIDKMKEINAGLKEDQKNAVKAAGKKIAEEKDSVIDNLNRRIVDLQNSPPKASKQQVREWARAQAKWASDLKKMKARRDRAVRENKQLKNLLAQKESVELQMRQLSERFSAVESKVDEQLPEVAELVKRAKELEEEKVSIQDMLNQHIKKHEEGIVAAQNAANEALAVANQAQTGLGTLQGTVDGLKGQVDELSSKMKNIGNPEDLVGIEQQLANMKVAIEKQITDGDQANAEKISAADAKISDILTKIEKLKGASAGSTSLANFRSETGAINSDLATLKGQLNAVDTSSSEGSNPSKDGDGTQAITGLVGAAAPTNPTTTSQANSVGTQSNATQTAKPSKDGTSVVDKTTTIPTVDPSLEGQAPPSENVSEASESSASQDELNADINEASETDATERNENGAQSAAPTADLKGQLGRDDQNMADFVSNNSTQTRIQSDSVQSDALKQDNKKLIDDLMSELKKVKTAIDAKKGNLQELRAQRDKIMADLEKAGADMQAVQASVIEKINSDPELLKQFQELLAAQEESISKIETDAEWKDKKLAFLLTVFGESSQAELQALAGQLQKNAEDKSVEVVRRQIYVGEGDNATTRVRMLVLAKYSTLKTIVEGLNEAKKGRLSARMHPLMAVRADVYLTVVKNMKNVETAPQRILLASTTQFGAEDFLSVDELETLTSTPQTVLALDNECNELDGACAKALAEADRGILNLAGEGLPKLAAANLKELACQATQATNQLKSVSGGEAVAVNAENLISQMQLSTEVYAARVRGETKDIEKATLSSDEPTKYTMADVELLQEDARARDVLATPSMLLTSFPATEVELVEAADLSGSIDKTKADTALQKMKDQRVSEVVEALFEKLGGCGAE